MEFLKTMILQMPADTGHKISLYIALLLFVLAGACFLFYILNFKRNNYHYLSLFNLVLYSVLPISFLMIFNFYWKQISELELNKLAKKGYVFEVHEPSTGEMVHIDVYRTNCNLLKEETIEVSKGLYKKVYVNYIGKCEMPQAKLSCDNSKSIKHCVDEINKNWNLISQN